MVYRLHEIRLDPWSPHRQTGAESLQIPLRFFSTNSIMHFYKQGLFNISNTIGLMALKLAHNNFRFFSKSILILESIEALFMPKNQLILLGLQKKSMLNFLT